MDVDIDFKDRSEIINLLRPITAMIDNNTKHNVGVYFQNIPSNPFDNSATINYQDAEELGYIKLDLLNLSIYKEVRDKDHLDKLVEQEPSWDLLEFNDFVAQLFQLKSSLGQHLCTTIKPKNISELAIVLALMRPGKEHLRDKDWIYIQENIWLKTDLYYFKKAHAYSYAQVVMLHMNIIQEKLENEL